MSAAPLTDMWAVVVKSKRSEWIYWPSVRRTRREAKAIYLRDYDPAHHANLLKHVRFARVTITEQAASGNSGGADRA